MQEKYINEKWVYAIFFALLFASLSWVIPAGYYTIAPQDRMLDVEEVSVDTTNPQEHTLNVTYEARGDYVVEAEVLLFQHDDDEEVDITQQKWEIEGFIEPGTHQTTLNLGIEKELPSGMYYYEVRIKFRPGYNVERTAVYKTTPFSIENNSSAAASNASSARSVQL